jgi:hypothetical protein
MRTRTAFFALAALAACVVGCGSSDDTVEPTAGSGGAGGTTEAGLGGTGGVGGTEAGPDVVAGTGGTGGTTEAGPGGTGGVEAGPDVLDETAGTSGTGGTGGVVPPVDPCLGQTPQRPLPYAVATDFSDPHNITQMGGTSGINVLRWLTLPTPDCNMAFSDSGPPAPPAGFISAPAAEAGADDGSLSEAAVEASPDDGAVGEASADDGAAEAAAEAGSAGDAADAGADVSPVKDAAPGDGGVPACWGFYYNPDDCATFVNDGGQLGTGGGTPALWECWAGVIFQPPAAAADAAAPGICIADGATTIEFWARASRDQARVKFGSTTSGEGTYETWLNITTSWTKYSIQVMPGYRSATAGSYGVTNGFSVVVEPADHVGGTYIYVKDMTRVTAAAGG